MASPLVSMTVTREDMVLYCSKSFGNIHESTK